MNNSGGTAVVGEMLFFFFVLMAAAYILYCLPLYTIFQKTGKKPAMAFVPFANSWIFFTLGDVPGILSIIPVANTIGLIMAIINVNKKFGQPGGIAVVGIFFTWIWLLMIGFGKAQWQGEPQMAYEANQPQAGYGSANPYAVQTNAPYGALPATSENGYGNGSPYGPPAGMDGNGGGYENPQPYDSGQAALPYQLPGEQYGQPIPQQSDEGVLPSLTDIQHSVESNVGQDVQQDWYEPTAGQAYDRSDYWRQSPASAQETPGQWEVPSTQNEEPSAYDNPSWAPPKAQDNNMWQPPTATPPSTDAEFAPLPPAGIESSSFSQPDAMGVGQPPAAPVPDSAEGVYAPPVTSSPGPIVPPPVSVSAPVADHTPIEVPASANVDDDEDDGETVLVRRTSVSPWMLTSEAGQAIDVHEGDYILGRKPSTSTIASQAETLAIKDPQKTVSKVHARLTWNADQSAWFIEDLDSTNGVFLGEELEELPARTPTRVSGVFYLGELKMDLEPNV